VNNAVVQDQLESLDDTDCYASAWADALAAYIQNEEASFSSSSPKLWGGRGKGGRGLARRTLQPKDIVVEDVRLSYLAGGGSGKGSTSNKNSGATSDALLEGATLKLLHGHVYALLGRNGCGKVFSFSFLRNSCNGCCFRESDTWISSLF
jgi:ABC-type multidrug transport system fused ATPase/permease subunit